MNGRRAKQLRRQARAEAGLLTGTRYGDRIWPAAGSGKVKVSRIRMLNPQCERRRYQELKA